MSEESSSNMSFFDHLEELRGHLFRSSVVILGISIILIFFPNFMFEHLLFGPLNTTFPTYKLLCRLSPDFCISSIPFHMMNTELAGQFTMHIKTAFVLGIIFSIPYIFWEVWKFIKPALTSRETNYAQRLLGSGAFLFFTGVSFAYFLVVPLAIVFFSTYSISSRIENKFAIDNYFSFLSNTIMWCGVSFELPILIYFLTRVGIVNAAFLQNYRRHLYVVIFVLAAIITPSPDVLSQVLVAIPLMVLYEASILVAMKVEKGKAEEEA
jgi:sec-independent protein translocase protein TatC